MSKFNSVEDAQAFLSDLENNLKQFEDQEYNINQDILKAKEEINSIGLLQEELRKSNYELWTQQTIQDKQVEEIESNEPTIESILGEIL